MSQKNREGKRSARERLREQRERERAADKRLRVLKVAGAMAAVLGVAAVTGVVVANQGDDGGGDTASAKPITQGTGRAAATLTVYEDFRCPACAQFENAFRGTIRELEEAGKLKTEYHIVTIIDGNMGGNGSKYAANAAACARDQGKFRPYHDVLFSNQPGEQDDAFGDKKRLLRLAGKVEGLEGPAFEKCVEDGRHGTWVERSNNAFLESGHNATPTVLLDGENVYADQSDPLTPEKLKRMVEAKTA
ncbi:hypothetical protein DVA86_28825 [Streptomyces armeniacus]|uniref:Thioredoxin-like fold domain-containing protein n=1 Tax=Streptomyces armeniacus TaxID=83291 RepID=A0A345XWK1_9ACTN|nr:thioredoxin domain-containing protein [Streptomyces armeniacus]AXK36017.1 hypothetical protein DVA86_28825 [Streptomyces armeniacus]